ncbi:MAG: amylo-alpha-1,6-glucosidase [Planctomycetota bacterium]
MTAEPLDTLIAREWLVPLGNGGYASSTWSGLDSRSYHGLLVGAFPAPLGRTVLVSHVDAIWHGEDGEVVELATHHYEPGIVHPHGFLRLESFRTEPEPTWSWRLRRGRITQRLAIERGHNAVRLEFRAEDGARGRLELRPFLTARSFHGDAAPVDGELTIEGPRATFAPGEGRPSVVVETESEMAAESVWHRNLRHEVEARRGYGHSEDLLSPLVIRCDLEAGTTARVRFADAEAASKVAIITPPAAGPRAEVQDERRGPALERLRRAAEAFLIRHPGSGADGILAGYHWFNEWGRDTMIALPGITLATGDWDRARSILEAWSARVSLGMLPNRLRDAESVHLYNSADAPLWFVRAVAFVDAHAPDDSAMRRRFFPTIQEILRYYVRGTRYAIRVDVDGLLVAGTTGTQLTWMDAKVGHYVVTPRNGKCVELNALFHDALRYYARTARRLGRKEKAEAAERHAELLGRSFETAFWCEERGHYRDVIGDANDEALRPNQLVALASSELPLDPEHADRALDAVAAKLWTPLGLRTLAPDDPRYRGRYEGDVESRDRAYHQGTVWPWLLGPFADALARRGRLEAGPDRERLERSLDALLEHLDAAAVGHLSEVFDGDAPHRPGGAVAQAWSAAEAFRAARALGWLELPTPIAT